MAKLNPLAQALELTSVKPATVAASAPPPIKQGIKAGRAPSRAGQILVGGFFAPEVHRQLRMLAAEHGETQQALLAQALNMLFAKHGKPEIAALGHILRSA